MRARTRNDLVGGIDYHQLHRVRRAGLNHLRPLPPYRNRKVIKVSHGVRLGPESDLACIRKGSIFHFEEFVSVQKHLEEIACNIDAELAPSAGGDLCVSNSPFSR